MKTKRLFVLKWAGIAVSLIGLYFLAFTYLIDKRPFVEWTLIKSQPEEQQAQAQLIKMPGGEVFLINAGDAAGSLPLFLKKQKIKDVDKLILSSNFPETVSGIETLIKLGVRVKEVMFNPMISSKSRWENVESLLKTKGIVFRPINQEEIFYRKGITQFNLVSIAPNSLAFKLIHGSNKVLLTLGEINLGCEPLPVDILINYAKSDFRDKSSEPCSNSAVDLAREKGTFKILLKGDSYKWKRGR